MLKTELKTQVKNHWETETCGTRYGEHFDRHTYFRQIAEARYSLEPYIRGFADFEKARGKKILEIGVGAGTDFSNWVKYAEHSTGVDLTEAAVRLTNERLKLDGVSEQKYELHTADVERLFLNDNSFDLVYSWGVIHHSPHTEQALSEIHRVLRPGGSAKIMVYHLYSWVTLMLYVVYGLAKGKPFKSPRQIVFEYLESPGTKVYTKSEVRTIFEKQGFKNIKIYTKLSPADSLKIKPSSKYNSIKARIAWALFPSTLVKWIGHRFGLYLLVEGIK